MAVSRLQYIFLRAVRKKMKTAVLYIIHKSLYHSRDLSKNHFKKHGGKNEIGFCFCKMPFFL